MELITPPSDALADVDAHAIEYYDDEDDHDDELALRGPGSRAEGMGEVHEVPDISFPYAPTFSTVFDSYLGFPGSWNRVEWLRDNNWIDLHTQWVAANAFLINPDLGVYCHVS